MTQSFGNKRQLIHRIAGIEGHVAFYADRVAIDTSVGSSAL